MRRSIRRAASTLRASTIPTTSSRCQSSIRSLSTAGRAFLSGAAISSRRGPPAATGALRERRPLDLPLEPARALGGGDLRPARLRAEPEPERGPLGQPPSARARLRNRRLGALGQRLVPVDRAG